MVTEVVRHAVEEAPHVGGQLGDVGGVACLRLGELDGQLGKPGKRGFDPVDAAFEGFRAWSCTDGTGTCGGPFGAVAGLTIPAF